MSLWVSKVGEGGELVLGSWPILFWVQGKGRWGFWWVVCTRGPPSWEDKGCPTRMSSLQRTELRGQPQSDPDNGGLLFPGCRCLNSGNYQVPDLAL